MEVSAQYQQSPVPVGGNLISWSCIKTYRDAAAAQHGDKIKRMAAQSASIEAGAVHLPINAAGLDEFRKEILAFQTSKHDDQIDALSQALQRANAPLPPMPVFGRHGSV